jgi:hypothetical protein
MNNQEKKKFIRCYLRTISNELLADVSKFPDHWDGSELKQIVTKRSEVFSDKLTGKRLSDFENECIIRGI